MFQPKIYGLNFLKIRTLVSADFEFDESLPNNSTLELVPRCESKKTNFMVDNLAKRAITYQSLPRNVYIDLNIFRFLSFFLIPFFFFFFVLLLRIQILHFNKKVKINIKKKKKFFNIMNVNNGPSIWVPFVDIKSNRILNIHKLFLVLFKSGYVLYIYQCGYR